MQRGGSFPDYQDVDDVAALRAAADALGGLLDEAGRNPRIDLPTLVGLARRRRRLALERFAKLADNPHRRPVVLEPADRAPLASAQGQPLTPLVTAGTADTVALASAEVWMPPGHAARAHVHHHTDVGVVVLQGQAITLWWDEQGVMHELVQRAGQHLHIPFGVVHAAINPFGQPVVAAEWRANRVFNADNERLPALDAEVRLRLGALMEVEPAAA